MASLFFARPFLLLSLVLVGVALAQNCYYAPGSQYQVDGLVPCLSSGYSTCCLAGDTCLAGNACFNYDTGTTYQYGCTDITYKDESCPFKCGWSPDQSPWVALEYCSDLDDVDDTWVCHSPESCGCEWRSTYDLLSLPPRGCKEMGYQARVGVYGPNPLLPYAVVPSIAGGSTGYFSTTTVSGTTVVSPTTAKSGYTPDSIGPITYATPPPRSIVQIDANADPSPSTGTAILITGVSSGAQPPIPITGPLAKTSSFPADFLAGVTTGLGGGNSGGSGGGGTSTGSGNSSPSSTGAGSGGSGSGSGSNAGSSSNDNSGSSSLSTGSKVGIGVGIAGGVCLLAAIGLTIWALRRRKRQPDGARTQDPDYAQGYHEKTHDKNHDSYNSYTSEAPATYYDAERRGSPSPGVYEAPYHTPQEEAAVKHRLSPLGPQELAGSPVAEMESRSTTPNRSPRIGHL